VRAYEAKHYLLKGHEQSGLRRHRAFPDHQDVFVEAQTDVGAVVGWWRALIEVGKTHTCHPGESRDLLEQVTAIRINQPSDVTL
jgi:hypothetical protein